MYTHPKLFFCSDALMMWVDALCDVQDDATALDLPTLRAWNLILRVFFAEYLGLRPDLSKREEPSPSTHYPAPVRKSDSELVRCSFLFASWDFVFSDLRYFFSRYSRLEIIYSPPHIQLLLCRTVNSRLGVRVPACEKKGEVFYGLCMRCSLSTSRSRAPKVRCLSV